MGCVRRVSVFYIITLMAAVGLFCYMQGIASATVDWFKDYPDIFAHEQVYIQADQTIGKLLVVGGDVTVSGKIDDGVIVIDGNLTINSDARIKDSVLVLGGYIDQHQGAQVTKKIVVLAPRNFPIVPFVVGGLLFLGTVSMVILPAFLWLGVRIFKKMSLYAWLEQHFYAAQWQWTAVYIFGSLAVSGLMLTFFVEMAWETMFRHTTNVVDNALIWLVRYFASPELDNVMLFVSGLGYSVYYGIFAAAVFLTIIYYRRWLEASGLAICLAGGVFLNVLLKHLFERARPDLFKVVVETGYSFPSGHAMVSLCFYGMVAFLAARNTKSKTARLAVMTGTVLMVMAIGVSRIYLGVHYPTDVLAGYAAGATWLALCIALLIWWEQKRVRHSFSK